MSVNYKQHPKSKYDLSYLGLNDENAYWNLTPAELYEQAIIRGEANLTKDHALRVLTGKFTGRSPKDKFIVDQDSIRDDIDWGSVNQPISEEIFENMYKKTVSYLQEKELFVKDVFCGADKNHR